MKVLLTIAGHIKLLAALARLRMAVSSRVTKEGPVSTNGGAVKGQPRIDVQRNVL